MRRITCLLLSLLLLFSLTACGSSKPSGDPPAQNTEAPDKPASPETPSTPETEADAEVTPEPEPAPVPTTSDYIISDPTVMPEGGVKDGVTYVAYNGIVEHLFLPPGHCLSGDGLRRRLSGERL